MIIPFIIYTNSDGDTCVEFMDHKEKVYINYSDKEIIYIIQKKK